MKILADAISMSEWTVNKQGDLLFQEHEFEGHDIISYKIVDDNYPDNDPIIDGIKTYAEAKKRLLKLSK